MNDIPPKTVPERPLITDQRGPKKRTPWLRIVLLVIVVAIIGVVIYRLVAAPAAKPAGGFRSSGPLPVGVAPVAKGSIDITLNALGTVTPLATVMVQSQVTGPLIEVSFAEGQEVKKGDLLAQIDPRPFQAALDQQTGQLAKDQALLKEAQVDLARYTKLAAENSIARQQSEDQQYVVQQDEGMVKVDEAMVNNAKINLGYTRIAAPTAGRIGLRLIDPGNMIQANGTTGIATITQMQPISVVFALAEDELPAVMKRLHAGATLATTAYDRSGATKLATGELKAVDSTINTSTGTVNLKAQFDNGDEVLFPNQFVNIVLLVDTLKDTITMPTAAVQRGAPGTFVYVVQQDQSVAIRKVKLGPQNGETVAVLDGLQMGDKVVIDGSDKLKDGAKITLRQTDAAPGATPASTSTGLSPTSTGLSPSAPGLSGQDSGQGDHKRHRDQDKQGAAPTGGGQGSQ